MIGNWLRHRRLKKEEALIKKELPSLIRALLDSPNAWIGAPLSLKYAAPLARKEPHGALVAAIKAECGAKDWRLEVKYRHDSGRFLWIERFALIPEPKSGE
jgi:hypothetical protein